MPQQKYAEQVEEDIQEKNKASYSDSAKLRYLASNHKGIYFENEEGLLDVAFEHDRTNPEMDGEAVRAKIKTYQDERFVAKVNILRDKRDQKYMGVYGASEVFEDPETARDWIKSQGVNLDELVGFNITEVGQ